jgi:outer membrane protein OmpA-like peptidoglycan-associated protein
MRSVLFASLLLVTSTVSFAQQESSRFHVGARASYLKNFHQTDAICPTCGTYSNGTGSGYAFEALGEVPFNFFRQLELQLALGIVNRGGDFGDAIADNLTVEDPKTLQYVPLVRQSSYSAVLPYFNFSFGPRFRPFKTSGAYITANLEAGIPLGKTTTYKQTEQIISPDGVYYPETNDRTRVDSEGVIPGIQTAFGLSGTLGYEVQISPTMTASPEISYYYPLNNVETAFRWRVATLRGGIALRWNKLPEAKEPPPVKPPTPPAAVVREDPNAMAPKLSAVSLSAQPLHIIETTVTETFPILPYIFFDSASATLPDRFVQLAPEKTAYFWENELPHRSLESYYQILNVIGGRMRKNEAATLSINGTTDGHEAGARELAMQRALTVRDYFTHVWNIPESRLTVTTSATPENPSSTEYAEGFEENRRVELSSTSEILRPIVHERFREETATPSAMPIKLAATSKIGVRDWQLAIRKSGQPVFETSGSGTPTQTVEWKPIVGQVESIAKTLHESDSLECELTASATNGAHSQIKVAIPATKTINPFELSRLSLIVFDFDQAAINKQNQRMISQFVKKSLYPASTITITGSTDNLGELKHNQKLSEDRAFHVRDLVLAEKPDAKITSTKGIGPSELLYDNHLPEGRYYCRTVRLEVETPIESVIDQH